MRLIETLLIVLASYCIGGWEMNQALASGIVNAKLMKWNRQVANTAAIGGKFLGAGGGGFLHLHAHLEQHHVILSAPSEFKLIRIGIEPQGSKIVCDEES